MRVGRKLGFKHSKETKEKIRQKALERIFPKGRKLSKEWRENIGKSRIYSSGKDHPFYGKKHSVETKKRIRKNHLGKNHSEKTKKKMSLAHEGDKHWNWQNGKSFEPYSIEFNNQLKEQIRKRDNFQCQFCGILENGRAHDVHHIDYVKKDCKEKNLITLYLRHNRLANYQRNKWQFLFETLQEIRRI